MNIFALCTGRSGSKTFYRACKHITNYTTGHESNNSEIGEDRLTYPDNHIEIDNRLSWFLGRMDQRYGDEAFYVHLIRDKGETAKSFNRRWVGRFSIIRAYAEGILNRRFKTLQECLDYYETVNFNIRLFLKDKSKVMIIHVNEGHEKFPEFWRAIGAEGNIDRAVEEFDAHHNQSKKYSVKFFKYVVWTVKNLFR